MLEQKDLQEIRQMISESEERMTAKISESEERMTAKITESEERSRNYMNVVVESQIMPMFNLLADGIKDIQEKLVPSSRVDDLEEDVKFLKLMHRQMSKDIAELKKAQ